MCMGVKAKKRESLVYHGWMWVKLVQYNLCMFMYDNKNMMEIKLNDKHTSSMKEGKKLIQFLVLLIRMKKKILSYKIRYETVHKKSA